MDEILRRALAPYLAVNRKMSSAADFILIASAACRRYKICAWGQMARRDWKGKCVEAINFDQRSQPRNLTWRMRILSDVTYAKSRIVVSNRRPCFGKYCVREKTMAQRGHLYLHNGSWLFKYKEPVIVDGKRVWKDKYRRLAAADEFETKV
jgi:hypothetical protein